MSSRTIEIPLHGKRAAGRVALIDEADHPLVMSYRWNVHESGLSAYAMAYRVGSGAAGRPSQNVTMHQLLTGWPMTDHVNHDGLDNRRVNLRPATKVLNAANSRPRGGTSKYRGVCWYARRSKWMVRIKINGRPRFLGYFADEEEAARRFDAVARAEWGVYACLNFPEGQPS